MNSFMTLLEHLCSLAVTLSSAANPAFSPVISLLGSGINAELAHIQAGNTPTPASLVENVAPGALALGATLAARNNPTHADTIAQIVGAVVSAIPTPSAHQNTVIAATPGAANTVAASVKENAGPVTA